MKSILLAAVALAALNSGAMAADAVAELPVASTYNWSGAYVGVNAGGGFGRTKLSFEAPVGSGEFANSRTSGFLGGVQAGYNWQSGDLVYGVEADFQGSSIKGDLSLVGGGPVIGTAKLDWFGTVRARIGYTPVDRFLVYGTGGLAYGHVKADFGPVDASKTKAGWTLGAGAEYALNDKWTFKTEYLYTDIGKATLLDVGPGASLVSKNTFHTIRVGLNYKF